MMIFLHKQVHLEPHFSLKNKFLRANKYRNVDIIVKINNHEAVCEKMFSLYEEIFMIFHLSECVVKNFFVLSCKLTEHTNRAGDHQDCSEIIHL